MEERPESTYTNNLTYTYTNNYTYDIEDESVEEISDFDKFVEDLVVEILQRSGSTYHPKVIDFEKVVLSKYLANRIRDYMRESYNLDL